MIKLIQFTDTRAVWSNISNNVPGFACRTVEHLDVLPSDIMLEFNCKESDLGLISNDRTLLHIKSKEHHIPEIKLRHGGRRNHYTDHKQKQTTKQTTL